MPSWNEKPHTIPTINVNLKPCICFGRSGPDHIQTCPGAPVLIPCPLPPKVEFMVRLAGECECTSIPGSPSPNAPVWDEDQHDDHCPARTIRVTCSIVGETWEGSEVKSINSTDALLMPSFFDAVWTACRELWALVKALALGASTVSGARGALLAQRTTVFATLADMARLEAAHAARKAELPDGIRPVRPDVAPESHEALWRYVQRLVEQVGVLP